ncbi:hypothetical protein CCP3SC15_1610009 [Gammaproteobacteria bacterium]
MVKLIIIININLLSVIFSLIYAFSPIPSFHHPMMIQSFLFSAFWNHHAASPRTPA